MSVWLISAIVYFAIVVYLRALLAPPSVTRAKVMPKEKRYHWKSCGQYCAAVGCSRNRRDNPSLSFFRFPKDEERQDILVINRVKRE